ncbi:MAG: thioredoxin domain-containing protein [Candidatus Paceibacterota bacterium]|jgi:protein-disulfide isomerase
MSDNNEMRAESRLERAMKSDAVVIGGSILLAGLIIAGSIMYIVGRNGTAVAPGTNNGTQPSAPAKVVSGLDVGQSPVLGDANAPHTIVEFGDFQCVYCTKFHTDMDPIIRTDFIQTGKAKIVFKTLAFLGPESAAAGLAAECAKDQGKFWDFHDAIYTAEQAEETAGKQSENSGNLTKDFFVKTAQSLGMDVTKFTSCYDGKNGQAQMDQYAKDMQSAGVQGTPTVFVDGTQLQNPFDITQYQAIIK